MKKMLETGVIVVNRSLSGDINEMVLRLPDISAEAEAGQFVMLKNESGSTYLRRPFGVADVNKEKGQLTVIYRLPGKGTRELSELKEGAEISVEGPLGKGFDLGIDGKTLLIGGGVGIAPIIYTAHALAEKGSEPIVLLGVKNSSELFWKEYFQTYAADLFITTDDGSAGIKGFAIDAMPAILEKHDIKHIKICGPTIMMEGLAKYAMEKGIECQVSMEKRMACGIGVCLGCTFEGKVSKKRQKVCADGPVFAAEEVFG